MPEVILSPRPLFHDPVTTRNPHFYAIQITEICSSFFSVELIVAQVLPEVEHGDSKKAGQDKQ